MRTIDYHIEKVETRRGSPIRTGKRKDGCKISVEQVKMVFDDFTDLSVS